MLDKIKQIEINDKFHDRLRKLMEEYVFLIYNITKPFPYDERFGVTSQLRRSALLIILNYIEGYARRRSAVYKNLLEISYGSLKESDFIVYFSNQQGYIKREEDYTQARKLADEIGAMLWSTIVNL